MNENTLSGTNEQNIALVMNHPVKELIWTINDTVKATEQNQWYNYTDNNYLQNLILKQAIYLVTNQI